MKSNTKHVAADAAGDEKLAEIRTLLNLPYPEIAAKSSALSLMIAVSRELLARLDDQAVPEFPGRPGSRWRDADGDAWMLGDDGVMRMTNTPSDPNDVAVAYGPMTRAGGA
ncbi:hypothetical protein Caci_2991 [Catenulispora acidiphila DSM 44928]|uniref:Uncharacterized protein n=1 Tax=Catenulispora acidiphila (strain DSM 44928 / JCM 14897 / NBRC 102108 / NRRL B-24433 / ID139908) TaxID=479433 RepID=C7Q308_CATAD|nr:hypothetical protein [Catenulispora acidiphila]ACU71900.1 hypothetical protein Caci_2991 [Catenulispora acidiphila DSM 44928]